MEYDHPATGPFWAQCDGLTGFYNSQPWQDGTNTPPDTKFMLDQKPYTHQPPHHSSYLLDSVTMQPMYPQGDTFEFSQVIRYVSPGATQASSLSEASYSGESMYSVETPNHPIRYASSPVDLSAQRKLELIDNTNSQNMPWQLHTQPTVSDWNVPMVATCILPSQPSLSIGDGVSEHEDDKDMVCVFGDEVCATQGSSPIQRPQPEEVEVSEPATDLMISSPRTYKANKSLKEYRSEDDMDEEDESVPLDADSDSDYQTQSRRRKGTRSSSAKNSKSPNHKRKSSKQSTQGNYRVHKRTESANKPTITAPSHTRRPSKPKAPRKGPVFPKVANPATAQPPSKADRVFPCTFHHFGCPAEFPNKNEWKRHVACQHLQLGYFRCDLDGCDPGNTSHSTSTPGKKAMSQTAGKRPSIEALDRTQDATDQDQEIVVIYNDFNRKDLFTQHCRRMHGPTRNPALCTSTNKKGVCVATKEDEASFERQLDSIRQRCWNIRRKAPARSNCGFCDQVFDAAYYTARGISGSGVANGDADPGSEEKAWEERMEHVGRHYEKDANARKEVEELDEDLVKWGLETEVFRLLPDGRAWLVSAEAPQDSHENGQGQATEDEEKVRKARRQPSRTVVVKKREPIKEEHDDDDNDSDVDADGEDE